MAENMYGNDKASDVTSKKKKQRKILSLFWFTAVTSVTMRLHIKSADTWQVRKS